MFGASSSANERDLRHHLANGHARHTMSGGELDLIKGGGENSSSPPDSELDSGISVNVNYDGANGGGAINGVPRYVAVDHFVERRGGEGSIYQETGGCRI